MKKPDDIKKALKYAETNCLYVKCCEDTCPYNKDCDASDPDIMTEIPRAIVADALAYIQQLEREKAALMVLVKDYRPCWECIHRGKALVEPCLHCDKDHNHFEWCGVKEDEK